MTRPRMFKPRVQDQHYEGDEDRREKGPPPTPANRVFCRDGYRDGQGPWLIWHHWYKNKQLFTADRDGAKNRRQMGGTPGQSTSGGLGLI